MKERKQFDYAKERNKHSELIRRNEIEEAKRSLYSTLISSLKFGQDISEEEALLNWTKNKDHIQILVLDNAGKQDNIENS